MSDTETESVSYTESEESITETDSEVTDSDEISSDESESPKKKSTQKKKKKVETKKKTYEDLSKEELIQILKAVKRSCYGNVELDFPMSDTIYEVLGDDINIFSKHTLSKRLPLKAFYETRMKGKMEWATLSRRKDLTLKFIQDHLKKLDLNEVFENHVLPYNYMIDYMQTYCFKNGWNWGTEICKIMSNTLKSIDYQLDQKINLIKLLAARVRNLIKNNNYDKKTDMGSVCSTYLKNIYKIEDAASLVRFVHFMKILMPIADLSHSSQIFWFFNSGNHSNLNKFEWKYLIDNKIIEYPKNGDKIPKHIMKVFIDNASSFPKLSVNLHPNCDYRDIDKLIGLMLMNGYDPNKLWKKISDQIIYPHKVPHWFLKKYYKDIDWVILVKQMINAYYEDQISGELFIKWFNDNLSYIHIKSKGSYNPGKIRYPDIMLYHFFDKTNLIPRPILFNVLSNQRVNTKVLEKMAPKLTDNEWGRISLCQYLDPEFIKKYEDKLIWNYLACNPTWQLYPHDQFHKLPPFDSNNEMLWMPLDQKVKAINNLCKPIDSNFNARLDETGNYIIIKSKFLSCSSEISETYSFSPKQYTMGVPSCNMALMKYNYYANSKCDKMCFGPELVIYSQAGKSSYSHSGICFRTEPGVVKDIEYVALNKKLKATKKSTY